MTNAPLREAIIDLAAFQANIRSIAGAAEADTVLVDVSANAYGHGLVPIAAAAVAAGAAVLEVADAREARQLESAGISVPVFARLAPRGDQPGQARTFGTVLRIGAEAYGVTPPGQAEVTELAGAMPGTLTAVMSLIAGVVSVKRVAAGHGVSYGLTYHTERASTLVIIPVGYADGILRAAGPLASVLLGGKRYRIAGRVAMDQFVVDVGDDPVVLGQEVRIFGDGIDGEPTADDWAAWAGATGDEVVAGIGPRVVRRYLAGS